MKVFNPIKALQTIMEQQSGQSPYLISIGERAEQIAQAFQDRQLTTQQALAQLQQLVAEYKDAEKARQKTDLSKEGFAVYWLLDREGVGQAERMAREVMEAFKQYPHWRHSGEQERQVRIAITKALAAAKVDQVSDHTERILQMLRRAE